MGGITIEKRKYTVDEYLELERQLGEKLNYYNGYIVPMPGGTISHNRISMNVLGELYAALKTRPEFEVFGSDQRVYLPEHHLYIYPDAIVVAGTPVSSNTDQLGILNPILVVEVLSPSTAAFDRTEKFHYLRSLPSFKEYALIEQDKPSVVSYFREEPHLWRETEVNGLGNSVFFRSVGVGLAMGEIYRKVEFE